MDHDRFDTLAQLFAKPGSRRAALGALLSAGLLGAGLDTVARDKKQKSNGGSKKKSRKNATSRQAQASAEAIPARCCSKNNCTPGPGKNLGKCCYEGQNLAGQNFKGANLGETNFSGANLTNANFSGANLGKTCFVDANVTGARFGGANTGTAIFCRTQTSSGIDNSDCGKGTPCCPTCEEDVQCGVGGICCNGNCKTGDCCSNADCEDPNEPACIRNTCSSCATDGQCGGELTCCEPICTDTGTDLDNCGVCGNACSAGEGCTDGDCCLPVTTFGNASPANGGFRLVSDLSNATPFGGVRFTLPSASVDFDDISVLQSAFNSENAPGCRAGSPRFQLRTSAGSVFVYFSPDNTCPTGPSDTGNLIGNDTPGYYDTSQIAPGTQVSTYTATKALLEAQGLSITSITLVVDGGATGNPQSVVVDPCVSLTPAPAE